MFAPPKQQRWSIWNIIHAFCTRLMCNHLGLKHCLDPDQKVHPHCATETRTSRSLAVSTCTYCIWTFSNSKRWALQECNLSLWRAANATLPAELWVFGSHVSTLPSKNVSLCRKMKRHVHRMLTTTTMLTTTSTLCFILFTFVIIASDIQATKRQDQKLQCLNERTAADETSAYQLKYNKPQAGRSTDLD